MCAKCETVKKLLNYEWVPYLEVAESLNLSYGECKELFEHDFHVTETIPETPLSPRTIKGTTYLRMKGRLI